MSGHACADSRAWVFDSTVWAQAFNEASIAFQTKMVANGGLGQDTYLPEGDHLQPCSTSIIHESLTSGMRCSQPGCCSRQDKAALVLRHLHAVWASFVLTHGCPGVLSHPPQPTMANARKEAEMVLFDSVGDVLRETNLRPRNVRLYTISK